MRAGPEREGTHRRLNRVRLPWRRDKYRLYLYDRAAILDVSEPFEVFSTASRLCADGEPFRVFLVSETGTTVFAREEYRVNPAFGFQNHPAIDVLMVVGGRPY